MFYENGSEYSIENATSEHVFTMWLDNRILPLTLNMLQNVKKLMFNPLLYSKINLDLNNLFLNCFNQVGGTTLPPNPMNGHSIFVPKNSDIFINVMHFVNWSQIMNGINGSSIIKVFNDMFYTGVLF